MKRFAYSLRLVLVSFVAAGVLATFVPTKALAQVVRAALVKNVDEPGRAPYQALQQAAPCPSACVLTFPAPPAGKRLVIEYISGTVVPLQATEQVLVQLFYSPCCPAPGAQLPVFSAISTSPTFGVSSTLRGFVEEGIPPTVGIASTSPMFTYFTISGYLIDKSI